MTEESLIGEMIDHLLDAYPVNLPPLRKVGKLYEIDCLYLGEHIQIYEYDLLAALKKWEEFLQSVKDKTGRG